MNKIVCRMILCLSVVCAASPRSFSVVPPSTMLEEEAQAPSISASDKAAFRKAHTAMERLEDDTRCLEDVVRDLKEDQQELKHRAEKTEKTQ